LALAKSDELPTTHATHTQSSIGTIQKLTIWSLYHGEHKNITTYDSRHNSQSKHSLLDDDGAVFTL
jgi:hypothetical protein